uniref:Lysosomal cobalamin transporter n=1 Tax=Macrostomum lignano TaxID=282301 RepID=A0A1I8JFG7_9PLAT
MQGPWEEPREESPPSAEAQLFDAAVRDLLISSLLFVVLFLLAYQALSHCRRADPELLRLDNEERIVDTVTLLVCTLSLAVAIATVLLLPLSVISNEVKLAYPDSFYMQWLTGTLVLQLWRWVSLSANLCIFLLLPFAYLFSESQGYPGSRPGLLARFYETLCTFCLLCVVLFGLGTTLFAFFWHGSFLDLWRVYLPALFSLVSFCSVLLLLLCTPMGHVYLLLFAFRGASAQLKARLANRPNDRLRSQLEQLHRATAPSEFCLRIGPQQQQQADSLHQSQHHLHGAAFSFGVRSLSSLGGLGALLQTALVLHSLACSLTGLYSLGPMKRRALRPRDTPLMHMLLNAFCLLLSASALPLQARLLGITTFSLLGTFDSASDYWLDNLPLILIYDLVFAFATALCVVNHFARKVWPDVQQQQWARVFLYSPGASPAAAS